MQWRQSPMVIINMIKLDGKASHSLSDAGIPSRVINSTIHIIHTCGIWLLLSLAPKDGCIQQNICDVAENVIVDLYDVDAIEDGDLHRFSRLINRIINITHAGDHPDEILMPEISAHQLGDDS